MPDIVLNSLAGLGGEAEYHGVLTYGSEPPGSQCRGYGKDGVLFKYKDKGCWRVRKTTWWQNGSCVNDQLYSSCCPFSPLGYVVHLWGTMERIMEALVQGDVLWGFIQSTPQHGSGDLGWFNWRTLHSLSWGDFDLSRIVQRGLRETQIGPAGSLIIKRHS